MKIYMICKKKHKKEKKMQVILLDFLWNQQLDNTPSPTVTNHAWKKIGPHPENVSQTTSNS